MMKRARRIYCGFTMIELLVVIGIMALLVGIMVPIGRRLTEGGRTNRCEAQLQRIGQALRLYYLDEQGVPPIGATAAGEVNYERFPGLQTLFRLDYMSKRSALHCPRHIKDSANAVITSRSPEYYLSYMQRDTKAKPSGSPLKQYKYMPHRFALPADYPNDYTRQLTRNVSSVVIGSETYTVTGASSAMPPDDTIVTWCDYHAETYKISKHGQYLVLYWDGSVQLLDEELFRDSTVDPAEAWLVKPTDIAH